MSSLAPPSVLPDISPSRGEIAPSSLLSPISNVNRAEPAAKLPISPLEGRGIADKLIVYCQAAKEG
ncbi:MAG: hypothetical protein E5V59_21535, partial [Mesorhizobium sp.]